MRAYTTAEAVQLALAEVAARDRKRRKMKPYFTRADRIKRKPGWLAWWDRPLSGTRDWENT